jgi:hemerythrin-like domain-containing protein
MLATEQLKQDHQIIVRFLAVLEDTAGQSLGGKSFPSELYFREIDFMRNFIDNCHHAKEEKHLLPAIENHGVTEGGLIRSLLDEHERGRRYVGSFDAAVQHVSQGDNTAFGLIPENARNYVTLIRSHVLKEDYILFEMADRLLSNREQEKLHDQFEEIEENQLGPGRHGEFVKILESWEHDFGLAHHFVH